MQDPHKAAVLTVPGGAMDYDDIGGPLESVLSGPHPPPVWCISMLGTNESVLESHRPSELPVPLQSSVMRGPFCKTIFKPFLTKTPGNCNKNELLKKKASQPQKTYKIRAPIN